jgi:protocatechuate 3,4-dioxygenase beta subunit
MRPAENIDKLVKKLHYTARVEVHERILGNVMLALDESDRQKTDLAAPNIWRAIMRSPITKITVAAVLILGLFILTIHLIGSEKKDDIKQTDKVATNQNKNQEIKKITDPQMLLEKELEMAKHLFEKKNLPGMTQLLKTGQDPTKLKIAEYLGQIGDSSVLSALQVFAEQWQGSELNNPFQAAIDMIEKRQEQPEPAEAASSQEPNEPEASQAVVETGIAGVVIDKNTGKPIEGAEVGFRSSEAVITDAEGRFRLVCNETHEEVYVYVIAPSYAIRRIVVRMEIGNTQNVTIELNQGSKFAGVVMDSNGQAVQGAEVDIFGLTHPALVTDVEGRFEIDGLNPVVHSYSVLVTHPMYPSVSMSFSPAAVGQTRYQEIILKSGVVVFGQVTDLQGQPVSGVTVGNTRSRAMWNCITTETDEEGMYRLGIVDKGDLILWAVHDSYAPYVERSVLAGRQVERRIDIQLEDPYVLNGRVVDGDNNSFPEATVVISEYNGVRNLDRNRHLCDPNGRFTIPNAPAEGELELRVFGEGITGKDHKVDFDQDECLIVVRRSGKIYGKVVDAMTGEPVPKFLVKMTASRVGIRTYGYSATWSKEGYTFDSSEGLFDTGRQDLPINGQYQITVSAEGYAPVTVDPVVVQPISEDPNLTTFTLQSAIVFAGRVIASDGQPIHKAVVVFFSNGNVQDRENWPRAVTDEAGIFTISGLDSEPQCVFVSAADFTPRVYLMSDLLENSNLLADIVLDRAAGLFGRVVDENGNAMAGVHLHAFVDLGRAREVLKRFPSLGPRATTDKDGYYQLSGVPIGQVQLSVMSTRNYPIGRKKIDLKSGDLKELNFGDEKGHVITGTVRAGNELLKDAQVTLNSLRTKPGDSYHNVRMTDHEGRFKIIHVPEGSYMIYVYWNPGTTSLSSEQKDKTKLTLRRPLEIHNDMELDIDMIENSIGGIGGGSVSGVVPEVLRPWEGLSLVVMRQVTSPEDVEAPEQWRHTAVPAVEVGSNGRFEVAQLAPGRYYLVLSSSERTLAISDIFEMTESEDLTGLYFHYGNGRMLIRVVDAGTNHPIPNAMFTVMNHMQTNFRDKRHAKDQDGSGQIMVVGEDGQCVYEDLPKGRYQVKADGYGYFLGQSAWVDVGADEKAELTIKLKPTAVVRFELTDTMLAQITKSDVLIYCKVTDVTTQALVKNMNLWGEYDSHHIRMSPSESVDDVFSVLDLPEGTFDIEYTVQLMNMVNRAQVGPSVKVAQGKTTVTCQPGQMTTIVVAGQ